MNHEQEQTKQESVWLDSIVEWLEEHDLPNPQWVNSLSPTRYDIRTRLREAGSAILRYTADPDIAANEESSVDQLVTLIRSLQAANKERDREHESDWLAGIVDTMVRVADERNLPNPPALPNGEHVVLMHGLGRSDLSMIRLQQMLINRGYAVSNIDYPSTYFTIEKLAEEFVLPHLERESIRHAPSLHFVTHSMGGILARYTLRQKRPPNLGRVVMLSPPNKGTEIVDILRSRTLFHTFTGPAGAQLGTDADSLPQKLGAVDFDCGVITGNRTADPIFSIMIPGTNDGKVSVERTKIEGMRDFLLVPHSHTFIMHSPAVIDQIITFLQTGAFAPPTPQ